MFHCLRHGEFNIQQPAVAQHHHKETEPPPGLTHVYRTKRTPVHLGAFSWGKGELEKGRRAFWPDFTDIAFDRVIAALKAHLLQMLKNLGGGVRMPFYHAAYLRLKRIKNARFAILLSGTVSFFDKPFDHGALVQAQFPGNLGGV